MSRCTKRRSRRRVCDQKATTININIGNSDDKNAATTMHNHSANEKKIVLTLEVFNSSDGCWNVINTNANKRIVSKL